MGMLETPPGWGKDSLTCFFEDAVRNLFATFHHEKHWVENLREIDESLLLIEENLRETKNIFEGLLLVRSHSAFRAACQLVFQTQVPESFVLMRSCLEYAGYGVLTYQHPELVELFFNRHESPQLNKEQKAAFQIAEVVRAISQTQPELGKIFKNFYDRTIDMGAHPNEKGMMQVQSLAQSENITTFNQAHLAGGPNLTLSHGLKVLVEVGLCSLSLFQIIFETRYKLLRLDERLARNKKNFLTPTGPKLLVPNYYAS
jgi:hypothetical protein